MAVQITKDRWVLGANIGVSLGLVALVLAHVIGLVVGLGGFVLLLIPAAWERIGPSPPPSKEDRKDDDDDPPGVLGGGLPMIITPIMIVNPETDSPSTDVLR